jgi:prepilin-type N-terminal cleavage/methylation domain-containing protein
MTPGHDNDRGNAISANARRSQHGFSLLETICAIAILAIGMMGGAVMIMMAITTNNRNKLDTGGTAVSQYVMELVMGQLATGNGVVPITDCLGNNFNIRVDGTGAAAGAGSPLTAAGAIDFSQGKVANYSMVFNSCRANGDPIPYDVRWNIKDIRTNGNAACANNPATVPPAGACIVYDKQIAVAARPTGAASGKIKNFAIPITLTGAVGQQ